MKTRKSWSNLNQYQLTLIGKLSKINHQKLKKKVQKFMWKKFPQNRLSRTLDFAEFKKSCLKRVLEKTSTKLSESCPKMPKSM